jgi:uncharacterized membrane protein
MTSTAAITIDRPREELQRLWNSSEHRPENVSGVTFKDAPGKRGTEIHLTVDGGRLRSGPALAKAKDALRHFKQVVETGEIARSDGAPQGEQLERKFKQRPAQPLDDHELEEVGAR